jgi:S-formylglutathione hydrolase
MSKLEILSTTTVTAKGGVLHRVKHDSSATKTEMIFAIFLPSSFQQMAPHSKKVLYWLSGLTCTDANFCQKAGGNAFGKAEEEGICMVMPDTSPRGDSIPSDDAYDLGTGAGFYINATNAPWDANYRMEEYITTELPALVEAQWGVGANGLRSIAGHSMGGRLKIPCWSDNHTYMCSTTRKFIFATTWTSIGQIFAQSLAFYIS